MISLEDIYLLLPKLSEKELAQLQARVDYLAKIKKISPELNLLSNEEVLHDVISQYCSPPFLNNLRQNSSSTGVYPAFRSVVEQLTDLSVEWELTNSETKELYRVAVDSAVLKIKARKEGPVNFNYIINLMNIGVADIISTSYPNYSIEFLKKFVLRR